ncbi:META domain-containing protein [Dyadobacter bucti]|uniref:META domain-containing protein n=1 Tax=Dyadobacter bucti TaxID=2572203 RepID=UPI001107EF06|nr:META domain-containing protein [Dyadobacter bucti]
MKSHLFLAMYTVLPALLSGCGKTTTINSNMELTGKWKLESIVQGSDTISRPQPAKGVMEIGVNFKEKGELEATSSTNYLTGSYEIAQQNTIQIGGGGTERAETKWGNLFVNALPNVNLYELKPNRLILYYDDNNQLIFNRAQ